MKSVTIKDSSTGKKLIKVYMKKSVPYCEALRGLVDFDVLIITENNERITIKMRQERNF